MLFLTSKEVIMQECLNLLRHIHITLKSEFNRALDELGLTLPQLEVLSVLKHAEEGLLLKEVEQRIHVAQSTTTGIVSRMEQKGLVSLCPDPKDRRAKCVRITDEGRALTERAAIQMKETGDRLFSSLSETEMEILRTLLQKMADNLS